MIIEQADLDMCLDIENYAKKNKKRKHEAAEPSPEPEKANPDPKWNQGGNPEHSNHHSNALELHGNDTQFILSPQKKTKIDAQVYSSFLSTEDFNAIADKPPPLLAFPKPTPKTRMTRVTPGPEEKKYRPAHQISTTLLEDHRGHKPRRLPSFQIYEDTDDSHVVPIEPSTHWVSWSSEEEKENVQEEYEVDSDGEEDDGEDGEPVPETNLPEDPNDSSADSTNSPNNGFRYVYPLQEVFIPGSDDFDRETVERRHVKHERDYFGYSSDDDADDEMPAEEDEKRLDMEFVDMMVQKLGSIRKFIEYWKFSSGGLSRDHRHEDPFTHQPMSASMHGTSEEQGEPYRYDRACSIEPFSDDPRYGTDYASEFGEDTD